jgi:Ran GTPase-activating protein (RanGAP) involved in mRNA processing and transport
MDINPDAISIDLSNQNIDDSSFPFLYNFLVNNPNLENLDLSGNNIINGIKFIGKALSKNNNLKILNLTGNPISSGGYKALAKGLSKNNTLEKLYAVSDSPISENVLQAFINALENNHTLLVLKIQPVYSDPRIDSLLDRNSRWPEILRGKQKSFLDTAIALRSLNVESTGGKLPIYVVEEIINYAYDTRGALGLSETIPRIQNIFYKK